MEKWPSIRRQSCSIISIIHYIVVLFTVCIIQYFRQTTKAAALLQAQQAQEQVQRQKQQAVMSALSQQLTGVDITTTPEPSNELQIVDEHGETVNWQDDPNEPRYCLCNQVSYGEMVGCDNDDVSTLYINGDVVRPGEAKTVFFCQI